MSPAVVSAVLVGGIIGGSLPSLLLAAVNFAHRRAEARERIRRRLAPERGPGVRTLSAS